MAIKPSKSSKPSKLWNVALILALLLLASVSYYKFAPVREFVDAKCPWVKEQIASVDAKYPWIKKELAQYGIHIAGAESKPATAPVNLSVAAAPAETATASVQATPEPPSPASPDATSSSSTAKMRLAEIAANRALWPKTVKIKKATDFPAVSNGKEVGKLNAPAGTEVKLISVTAEKIGVAYSPDGSMRNAGGAWLSATETDLLERVQAAAR